MSKAALQVLLQRDGTLHFVYGELVDLSSVGALHISRASHVEPDLRACWTADLSLVGGPVLGSFLQRSQALDAERAWLNTNLLGACADEQLPVPVDYESHVRANLDPDLKVE